jgi:AraC-like DNA-binding protein
VKARFGLTTVQLIRKQRLQRAYHLLIHSTMPIKVVAAESGLSDLQQFNKQMRREYGKSPRALRASHIADPTWSMERK